MVFAVCICDEPVLLRQLGFNAVASSCSLMSFNALPDTLRRGRFISGVNHHV